MNKGKLKKAGRKYLSVVFVPHSSNQVKVIRLSSFYGKVLTVSILVLAVLICTGMFLAYTVKENRGLKENLMELYNANAEQRQVLDDKVDEITQLENDKRSKEEAYNQKINEVNEKFKQITDQYLAGQDGTKTSRSGDRSDRSFTDDIGELKNILDDLNEFSSQPGTVTGDLSDVEKKLDKFLETVPTFWPAGGRISDDFGYRRDPFTGRKTFHEGLDIAADYGDSIKAAANGKVTMAARYGGYGRAVIIDHGRGISTLYGHASKLLVKEGQSVKKGDVIAKVGSSGRSTGAHLHFQVMLYNTPVDPIQYLDER